MRGSEDEVLQSYSDIRSVVTGNSGTCKSPWRRNEQAEDACNVAEEKLEKLRWVTVAVLRKMRKERAVILSQLGLKQQMGLKDGKSKGRNPTTQNANGGDWIASPSSND